MYPTYAQNIGPAQGAQPNDQGRPLSNYAPVSPSNTAGNFTTPLDLNNTAGNFSGAPNQLNNFTSPAGNPQEGAPAGNAAEGAPAGNEGGLGPNNQSLANQATPNMNNTIPPPKPVIFTKNLSNNSGTSSEQKVATSGSNVYVAWEDTSSGANSDILFARSGNNGATFGNVTTNLSNNTGESTNPKIATFRNNVYVIWEDTSSGGNSDILFTKSTDSGATFGNVTNLSNNTGESTNPQIFASGKNVYVAWEDTTLKKSDILFARSENNGATFGNVTANLSDNTGQSTNPKIAAFRNNVYVVWEDYSLINSIKNQILFTRSTDNGMTFDNTIRLNNNTGQSTNPKIATFKNNVYVVWEDTSSGGNSDVAFTSSPNNGATFGNVINVNAITGQPLPGQPLNPQILASRSSVYIAWTNRNITTGNDIVLFAKSSNNG
ncbi:MAG: sialidase family protein, partial [Nitrososphaeraceae archaeon]